MFGAGDDEEFSASGGDLDVGVAGDAGIQAVGGAEEAEELEAEVVLAVAEDVVNAFGGDGAAVVAGSVGGEAAFAGGEGEEAGAEDEVGTDFGVAVIVFVAADVVEEGGETEGGEVGTGEVVPVG